MGKLNDPSDDTLMKQNIDFLLSLDALESKDDWDLMSESSDVLQDSANAAPDVESELEGDK